MFKFFLKKVNSKRIAVFALGMIIIGIMLIIIPKYGSTNSLSNYIGNLLSYNDLPESRKNNYDKMKISHVEITSRKTGTKPFNNANESDDNGIDISEDDNYVRTFDTIGYTLEIGIESTENVASLINSNGGVIKVQATLPNQGSDTLMEWVSDAWMQNVTISSDKRTIYAEYISKEDTNLIGALQKLTFTVKVNGFKKNVSDDMKPTFEIWMEGNKPDNDDSNINSVVAKDEKPIIISGTPCLDVDFKVASNNVITTRKINDNEYKGRYDNLGISVAMAQRDKSMPDLRGSEYPSGKIELKTKLTYKYRNIQEENWNILNEDTANAIDKINGFEIVSYGLNGNTNETYVNKINNYSPVLPYSKIKIAASSTSKNSAYDTGIFNASLSGD